MAHRLIGLAIGWAALAIVACDGPWRHEMRDQPPPASTQSPREPAQGTLATTGEPRLDRATAEHILQNPIASGPAPNGRALYQIYCVPCHGISGTGDGLVARHFMLDVNVRPADLTSDTVQGHTDGWLYGTITNGTARMPAYRYELTPRERWEIVTFVRRFDRRGR